jgi:hypothetical protein
MQQVKTGAIATDPNFCREYGGGMADEPKPEPQPDTALPAEPADAGDPLPVGTGTALPEPAQTGTALPEPAETGYTTGGVPTFDSVREKIEARYGTAIGAAELAAETPEGRSVEEQYDNRQRAAAERLAQIRQSMSGSAAATSDAAEGENP